MQTEDNGNLETLLKKGPVWAIKRSLDIKIKSAELAGRNQGTDLTLARIGKKIIGE